MAAEIATKIAASLRDMAPRGSSRPAVRGLSASQRASASRLNPIAALRAATIATTIQSRRQPIAFSDHSPVRLSASSAPVSANGSAKTLWLNRTNEA